MDSVAAAPRTALLAGATGLVGDALLSLLVASKHYCSVHVLLRRAPPDIEASAKLKIHQLDFARLPAAFPAVDDVFIALGTTSKVAGSEAAFRQVDFDFVVNIARAALAAGATRLAVVSALGADPTSRIFYNRVKGEMEIAVLQLGYESVVIAQPSMLLGGNSGLVDASALLWRLQLRGTRSQRRWREVTGLWMRKRTIGNRAFDLVHAVIAFASSKQHARARQLAKRLKVDTMLRARSGNEELALAEPLIAAIMSFCRGDYEGAVASISAIRAAVDRCGGSVAQCDLIHLTLLEAALRGHRKRLARTLADERVVRKPASRLNRRLKARAWTLGTARLATQA